MTADDPTRTRTAPPPVGPHGRCDRCRREDVLGCAGPGLCRRCPWRNCDCPHVECFNGWVTVEEAGDDGRAIDVTRVCAQCRVAREARAAVVSQPARSKRGAQRLFRPTSDPRALAAGDGR